MNLDVEPYIESVYTSNEYDGEEHLVIPDKYRRFSHSCFWKCTSLVSVVIPDSVTEIGVGVFGHCTSLRSVVIPGSVTRIDLAAFLNCTSLTSIVIPNSVTEIGECAFAGCTSLTSIVVPDSVTSIENGAFCNCTSLTSIVVPNSVTKIESSAFVRCDSLIHTNRPDLEYPNSPHLNKLKRYPKDLNYWSPELNPLCPCPNNFLVLSEYLPPELIFLVLSQNKNIIKIFEFLHIFSP